MNPTLRRFLLATFALLTTTVLIPTASAQVTMVDISEGLADLAETAQPSVVNINVSRRTTMRMPFGGTTPQTQTGAGSGVIIREGGIVVTNNHVVEDAAAVSVTLNDGRELDAEIVGTDPDTDLAVLRISNPPDDLVVMNFGSSESLRIGELVVAIGNPFGLSSSVSLGIVSATGRDRLRRNEYGQFIQTDAAINPGNSGGALVNASGELVGINTAIFSRSGGNQGIGFAIPADLARRVVDDLVDDGAVHRGWQGVGIQDLTPQLASAFGLADTSGAVVGSVEPGSPAQAAGLQPGDVIVAMDGNPIDDVSDLRNTVAMAGPDNDVMFDIYREGSAHSVAARLGERGETSALSSAIGGLGFSVAPLPANAVVAGQRGGLIVESVEAGSAAASAGLRQGDVILEAAGASVATEAQLEMIVGVSNADLLLRVLRGQNSIFIVVER